MKHEVFLARRKDGNIHETQQCANSEKKRKFLTLKTCYVTDKSIDLIKNRNN